MNVIRYQETRWEMIRGLIIALVLGAFIAIMGICYLCAMRVWKVMKFCVRRG